MVQKLRALPQLQPDKLSELRPFLVANDRDSSGTLSKDEFARALREDGFPRRRAPGGGFFKRAASRARAARPTFDARRRARA